MSDRARVALLSALVLLAAPAAHAKAIVTKWFPFELAGGHIHVPVKIEGVETTAVLDTGAALHMLDRGFAMKNGIAFSSGGGIDLQVQGVNSRERVPVARNVPIELFGASVKLKFVAIADVPGADILIGNGVLQSFVMQIDYANSQIRFASFEAVNLKESANVEMRSSGANGLPAVRATLDGEEVWLMLDTGLTGPLILNPRLARDRGWEPDRGALAFDALGTLGAMDGYHVPLLQLGPFDLTGVSAAVPRDGKIPALFTASEAGRVGVSGILGAEVLQHFLVTIDLKHMRVHFAPSQRRETESWESSAEMPAEEPAKEEPPED